MRHHLLYAAIGIPAGLLTGTWIFYGLVWAGVVVLP